METEAQAYYAAVLDYPKRLSPAMSAVLAMMRSTAR